MKDIVLDTNILADLLAQFYSSEFHKNGLFQASAILERPWVQHINSIIQWHTDYETLLGDESPGLVVASTFAFVEIARKFDDISHGRFTISQFQAFISQPPGWFFIASCDYALLEPLELLPASVALPNHKFKRIELADAIHAATSLSRDHSYLATTDSRLKAIDILQTER